MGEAETTTARRRTADERWVGGLVGGLVGGVVFGLLLQFAMGITPVIGALYGMEGPVVGWMAHLFHSVVFGLVFAAAVVHTEREDTGIGPLAAVGAGYGAVLWVVATGVVMPLWLGALGMDAPPIPNLDSISLVGHVAYGVVLALVFAFTHRW